MKIMHINCSCLGSTGKIIQEIASACKLIGWETVLCAPVPEKKMDFTTYKTSFKYEQGIYRRLCYFVGLQYGFAPISTFKIINIIKKEKPDVVHIHSANCNMVNIYKMLGYLKKNSISTVITNHAEFFYTGSCVHAYECQQWIKGCIKCENRYTATHSKFFDMSPVAWKKMRKAFEGFSNIQIVSVSEWINSRAKTSMILGSLPNMTVRNGVNTNTFFYRDNCYEKEKYNIPDGYKIVLHVTVHFSALDNHPKGGKHIIKLAQALENDKIIVLVVGKSSVSTSDIPNNIRILGEVVDQSVLAELYSLADLTVISSIRETYSMPVAESLCCGTPVVGFRAGGPETIAMKEFSKFVDYGDIKSYAEAVRSLIELKKEVGACNISKKAIKEYSSTVMSQQYIKVYDRLSNGKK